MSRIMLGSRCGWLLKARYLLSDQSREGRVKKVENFPHLTKGAGVSPMLSECTLNDLEGGYLGANKGSDWRKHDCHRPLKQNDKNAMMGDVCW